MAARPEHSPDDISFLFRVDELQPNFAAQAPLSDTHGLWMPPNQFNAYHSQNGVLYRWTDGVVSQPATDTVPASNYLTTHENNPRIYSVATLFTRCPSDQHFLAAEYDVRWNNVCQRGGWRQIGFDHEPHPTNSGLTFSDVGIDRDHQRTAGPRTNGVSRWQTQLFTNQYHWDSVHHGQHPVNYNGGLIGRLSVILALVAFSCPRGYLHQVLRNNLARGVWIPHQYPHGRVLYRGVVVSIWLDEGTDSTTLMDLEAGEYGAFFAP